MVRDDVESIGYRMCFVFKSDCMGVFHVFEIEEFTANERGTIVTPFLAGD